MNEHRSWNSALIEKIENMRSAALSELDGEIQRAVVGASDLFACELENTDLCTKTGRYGTSFGVREQNMDIIWFLRRWMPEFMNFAVFDINTPGMKKLLRRTGCLFFVRLDISVPLALALLVPELETAKL